MSGADGCSVNILSADVHLKMVKVANQPKREVGVNWGRLGRGAGPR